LPNDTASLYIPDIPNNRKLIGKLTSLAERLVFLCEYERKTDDEINALSGATIYKPTAFRPACHRLIV
jgi:hypothetical protein